LYAYRCSEKKYDELAKLVKHGIDLELKNKSASPQFPALFCLYAAETFCRKHSDGVWAWDTIFNQLGIQTPSNQKTSNWVNQGLEWWGRPLIRRQSGDRQFLVTIACEGGLPLNLLRNKTAISQFFRSVLENYHARRLEGEDYAEQIASEQASLLPSSLRQDVVFRLAGKLIAKIVEFQGTVSNAANPVEELNATIPDWRKQLPLRLEDETAEVLLTGLVHRSSELSKDFSIRMRWRGWLRETANGWQVEKVLDAPERLSVEQVATWTGLQQISIPRLRMILHTPDGNDAVALLTLNQRGDGEAIYRREWLRRAGVKCNGSAVSLLHEIHISLGETTHRIPIYNGEPWGELPWVFVGRDGSKEWEWLTEGSASTRSEIALVLVKENVVPLATEQGEFEKVGAIHSLKRVIYCVMGDVKFVSAIGDSYRIRCRAECDSDESFELVGNTVNDVLNERPVFRGLPSIMVSNASGQRHRAIGKVQWRPLHEQGAWRDNEAGCRGRVWLCLMETDSNVERFRCQVDVVPKSFRIERMVGTNNRSGEYRLCGVNEASLSSIERQTVDIQAAWNEIKISCLPLQNTAPEALRLLLYWSSVEQLEIALPYPQRGAVFQLTGKTLVDRSVVPLGRLGGLQLFLQDQSDNSRFILDVQLQGSSLGFRQQLPALQNGRLAFSLEVERDRIASLLASTDNQDVSVEIKILCGQECLAAVNLARFDVAMQPNYANNYVVIGEKSVPRLGDDWETRIQVEMIPLWNPMAEPLILAKSDEYGSSWDVPANLDVGPWWIMGRDGDWTRFRPLLWSVKYNPSNVLEITDTNLSLKTAILEKDEQKRNSQLADIMIALGQNAEHSDWPLMFDYIRLTREFPPSSLDVLKQFVTHPPALALALLKVDENTFDQLWSLSEQMPFSWSLVPVKVWGDTAQLYFNSLHESLACIESAEEIVWNIFKAFRERTVSRRDSWKPLCDWLQEQLFLNKPTEGGSLLQLARMADGAYLKDLIPQAEQELQGRHSADEQWPQSREVMLHFDKIESKYRYNEKSPPFRPVRCAPFVAAQLSLQGIQPSPMLVYELRLIRAFDSKWFFEVYGIALALGLAAMPQEKK
jgi:hypothetical protein